MNPAEFARVCDSLRPLLWALAIVVIIAAVVWGSGRALPPPEKSA